MEKKDEPPNPRQAVPTAGRETELDKRDLNAGAGVSL